MSRNGTSQAMVTRPGPGPDVIVFGQIARDLVLVVDAVPTASRSADVYQRRELLGGKGAKSGGGPGPARSAARAGRRGRGGSGRPAPADPGGPGPGRRVRGGSPAGRDR